MPDHWHVVQNGGVDINLRDCHLGEEDLNEVARALMDSTTNVHRLNLTGIGTNGVTTIAQALKVNSTLQSLDLCFNEFGDVAVTAIAEALTTSSALQVLRKKISENSIGVCGAKGKVSKAWKYSLDVSSKLEKLSLSYNTIGKDGATAIAESLKFNSTLQALNLRSNEIGDDGILAIAETLHINSSLQTLNLGSTSFGDDGARALGKALETNSTLQTLDLTWNGIGIEARHYKLDFLYTWV